ncbi:amidohydrolase family protein [Lentzea sp. NPDC058450]|uniref:amidohydrolase family protein n=1 Tax=Lentzea sp. NPDC058450 TaxID=3346505 RepID=UPI0036556E16
MNKRVVLHGGLVFDGVRSHGPGWVLLENGLIEAVEHAEVAAPTDAEVVDFGPDAFVMPGLVDAHVHLCMGATDDAVGVLTAADDDALLDTAREAAQRALRAGITTVRDLGDRAYTGLRLRDEYGGGREIGPHLVVAGPPVTTTGGHCHFLGGEAEGREALRAAVRERAERGCDVLKVMASGGSITPGSVPHLSQYARAELEFLAEEAHRLGMTAAAHAHGTAAIADAAAAGFDTIEHATFATPSGIEGNDAVVELLAASDVTISATMGFHPDSPVTKARNPSLVLRGIRRRLHRLGVPLVVGTDAGIDSAKPHDVLPHGVEDLPEFGMSTVDALRSATSVAAHACGVGTLKGRLATGYDADVLVVTGNPLETLADLREVTAVFRAGVRVR